MRKIPTVLAIIFFLNTLFLIYFFVFKGTVIESEDHRVAVKLSESNTNFALLEMLTFLESVQQINQGILNKDADLAFNGARQSGSKQSIKHHKA